MTYELRNPQASDLFVVSKIIKAVGIKNIANCFKSEEIEAFKAKFADKDVPMTEEDQYEAGMIAMTSIGELIFEKLDLVQEDIFKFLSNLSGLKVEDVKSMDIVDFAEMFIDVIKNPKLADFIKVVLRSFK